VVDKDASAFSRKPGAAEERGVKQSETMKINGCNSQQLVTCNWKLNHLAYTAKNTDFRSDYKLPPGKVQGETTLNGSAIMRAKTINCRGTNAQMNTTQLRIRNLII